MTTLKNVVVVVLQLTGCGRPGPSGESAVNGATTAPRTARASVSDPSTAAWSVRANRSKFRAASSNTARVRLMHSVLCPQRNPNAHGFINGNKNEFISRCFTRYILSHFYDVVSTL